jgi:hypothetical protein
VRDLEMPLLSVNCINLDQAETPDLNQFFYRQIKTTSEEYL